MNRENQGQSSRGFTWMSTSITFLFGMQFLRNLLPGFVYYLRDSRGVDSLNLAPIALGVFAICFLTPVLNKIVGNRISLAITAGGIAILRIADQIVIDPGADLILAAAGVVLFGMYIPIMLSMRQYFKSDGLRDFTLAALLGITADTAIHSAVSTLDLTWQSEPIALIIIIILALASWLDIMRSWRGISDEIPAQSTWRRTLTIAGIGPWLFLQLLIFQNVARLTALTNYSLPAVGVLTVLTQTLGMAAVVWLINATKHVKWITLSAGVILFVSLINPNITGIFAAISMLIGSICSTLLFSIIITGLPVENPSDGLGRTTVANGVGQILLVILTFVYYITYDLKLGFQPSVIPPTAGLILSVIAFASSRIRGANTANKTQLYPVYIAALMILMPIGNWITWIEPEVITPDANNYEVRVMTYNLHQGFDTKGRLDIEALARIILNNEADIVALQEISRGWVINGSFEMLSWLSQRLDMPYISGPAADPIWGNAILSRYPILTYENYPLPPDTLAMKRSYLLARIDIGGGILNLIATHLHHLGPDSEIRQEQVPVLIDAWGGESNTLILGDLNATPDAPEMKLFVDAGLIDLTAELSTTPTFTYYSEAPDHQLDYIWASPDIIASELYIPLSTASDHLPVIVSIQITN